MAKQVDAHKLRALLEECHGEPAMLWRDHFALGCWLYTRDKKGSRGSWFTKC